MRKINLFFEKQKIANISFDGDSYQLDYEVEWVRDGFELSPALDFKREVDSLSIKRFLENLLPEGEALEDLLSHYNLSKHNVIRVTELIGEDAVGAIKFTDELKESSFRALTEDELRVRLSQRGSKSLIFWDNKPRLSAAGVQDKLTVTLLGGKMGFGEGDIASTHILKFQKENNKFRHLVPNEYFCMKLAKSIGLEVCEVSFKRIGSHPVLFVERFDREAVSSNEIKRIHVIDGCQALNLSKTYKYEKNFGSGKDVEHIRDGVSFKKLFDFSMHTKIPAITITKITQWMIFNLLVSNFDAHGKNISFFISKKGIELAPFYDIVNVSVYDEVDHDLAMAIGGEFNSKEVRAFQLSEFCDENNIKKTLLMNLMKKMILKLEENISQIELPDLFEEEKNLIDQIKETIMTNIRSFKDIYPDINKV